MFSICRYLPSTSSAPNGSVEYAINLNMGYAHDNSLVSRLAKEITLVHPPSINESRLSVSYTGFDTNAILDSEVVKGIIIINGKCSPK